MRHLLEIDDLNPSELKKVIALSLAEASPKVLDAKGVALIFEKPSGRTRNSMEMAVNQLGGHPVYIQPDELGIDGSLPCSVIKPPPSTSFCNIPTEAPIPKLP